MLDVAVQFQVQCQVRVVFYFVGGLVDFDLSASDDMYSQESLEPLQKAGFDFQRHEEFGILPNDFAELMITSGLVLLPETKWISFHRFVACLVVSSHERFDADEPFG